MANYAAHFSTLTTPQREKAKPDQVQNSAGGFVFEVSLWDRLDRWLVLGNEGGTYYASERKLTRDNAQAILECLKTDGARTINRIVELSDSGRIPKNDTAIFALAMAAGDEKTDTRKAALAALPKVCRTATHLFHFVRDVETFRKWGRSLRTAVAAWYNDKTAEALAYQLVKYQRRDGWSHKDLLRLSHPQAPSDAHSALYRYSLLGLDGLGEREVVRGKPNRQSVAERVLSGAKRVREAKSAKDIAAALGSVVAPESQHKVKYGALDHVALPAIIEGFERVKLAKSAPEVAQLILDFGLTHEMIPTEWKNDAGVWEALLQGMPMTAMIRNLAKMTQVGLLAPLGAASQKVVVAFNDVERIRKARIHPIAALSALKVYQQGYGERGKLTWSPVARIVDALDSLFYQAFETIEPTGKSTMLCLDISSSMNGGAIAGCPGLNPRVASAAMAMVTAKSEPEWAAVGFSHALMQLNISSRQRLDDVIRTVSGLPFGGTDCALPMVVAAKQKLNVDTFVIFTDNETWYGGIHPFQALRDYRQSSGRSAKLIVVGMTATNFTIADPSDAGMMDVVGFDSAAPQLIADFARQ